MVWIGSLIYKISVVSKNKALDHAEGGEKVDLCCLFFLHKLSTSERFLHKEEQECLKLLKDPSYLKTELLDLLCWGGFMREGGNLLQPFLMHWKAWVEDAQPYSRLPSDAEGHEFHFLCGWFQGSKGWLELWFKQIFKFIFHWSTDRKRGQWFIYLFIKNSALPSTAEDLGLDLSGWHIFHNEFCTILQSHGTYRNAHSGW